MDIMLPLVNLDQESYEHYVAALQESNLPKTIRWDLLDLLKTVLAQTQQAETMGWL